MKGFRSKSLFFTLTLLLAFSVSVSAEVTSEVQKVEAGAIVIKSNSIEIDNSRKMVIFTGNVDARKDDFTINCQKILLYYRDKSSGGVSGKMEFEIDKIVATEKVTITRTDGGLATAEKAIYYQDGEKVVLTGDPVVKQGSDFVEGGKITLFLKEKRSIVEGAGEKKVKAVLFPGREIR